MSNIHLHNTIQHAFAALMQVQTPHLCIVILSRTSCTHHHHQRRRQWIIFAVPTETKLGSTTFRFGSEHQRKMSSIDPATGQSRLWESRRSVILLMEDSRVIGVFCWRLIFALCGRVLCQWVAQSAMALVVIDHCLVTTIKNVVLKLKKTAKRSSNWTDPSPDHVLRNDSKHRLN